MTDITGGAVEKARNMTFANKKIKVNPTLCYGVQWDATLNFIDPDFITNQETEGIPNCKANSYLVDSTDKGWYSNNSSENSEHKTGVDLEDKVNSPKNIYDMGGNIYEWIMESCYTEYRVVRGGDFSISGRDVPSSSRGYDDPGLADDEEGGFRVTLYL